MRGWFSPKTIPIAGIIYLLYMCHICNGRFNRRIINQLWFQILRLSSPIPPVEPNIYAIYCRYIGCDLRWGAEGRDPKTQRAAGGQSPISPRLSVQHLKVYCGKSLPPCSNTNRNRTANNLYIYQLWVTDGTARESAPITSTAYPVPRKAAEGLNVQGCNPLAAVSQP